MIAIDVGCGSGWKLVNYLSGEFHTIGIETEPALSFLRKTYPDQVFYNIIKVYKKVTLRKRLERTDCANDILLANY